CPGVPRPPASRDADSVHAAAGRKRENAQFCVRYGVRGGAALHLAVRRLVRRSRGEGGRWRVAIQAPDRAAVGWRGAEKLPRPRAMGGAKAARFADHKTSMKRLIGAETALEQR